VNRERGALTGAVVVPLRNFGRGVGPDAVAFRRHPFAIANEILLQQNVPGHERPFCRITFVQGSDLVKSCIVESEIGAFEVADNQRGAVVESIGPYLRQRGRPWNEIRTELLERKSRDYDWRGGRIPLYVYHDNDELLSVAREAYGLYFSENALGGRAFPSLVRMEQELVRMSLDLFHAPSGAAGTFTSGGTESIFLALKTARDRFRAHGHRGVPPNVVIPRTAHPAFDKSAHYLDVGVRRIDVGADLRVNVAQLEAAIDPHTMLIAGSAPCYPYGVYDNIERLSEIAISRSVWLHVDACLGGFLAPFARDEGYPIPDFDFVHPGVTSLSADLHKYGFSAKGASVLLYQSATLKAHQSFDFDDWPRGKYFTESFLGTRPGGAIASAWAVAQYLGRDGYRRLARKTLEAKEQLIHGIEKIDALRVVRPSELCIVLYRSSDSQVDIGAVAEMLAERGWFVGRTREPQALHFALNAVHAPVIAKYLDDLSDVVALARSSGRTGVHDDRTY
jgi:sphinganine-1-phosphate aldolase